jgi:hypothetical protein
MGSGLGPDRDQGSLNNDKLINKNSKQSLERPCRLLRIGTICINQSDTAERSSEIQRMTQIYKRAARVHIFLDTPETHTSSCLESKWFTRRWVIQEAMAASKVLIHVSMYGIDMQFDSWKSLLENIRQMKSGLENQDLRSANLLEMMYIRESKGSGILSFALKILITIILVTVKLRRLLS